MSSESVVQKRVWATLARRRRARAVMFRTNSGKAWLSGGGPAVTLPNKSVLVPFGRPVALGLATMDGATVPGLPDLTGWTEVVITPEMVGRTIPVFTWIDAKESGGGKRLQHQINCMKQLHQAGGIAGFAQSEEAANEVIDAWLEGRAPDV